jgi:hypothetical protein
MQDAGHDDQAAKQSCFCADDSWQKLGEIGQDSDEWF